MSVNAHIIILEEIEEAVLEGYTGTQLETLREELDDLL